MIFDDFQKAVAQLGDRRFRRVLLRALGLTLLLLGPFVFGFTSFVSMILPDTLSLPWIGEITIINGLVSGLSLVVFLFLSMFLMIPVATVFVGIFVEEIAEAVEQKHYPHLPAIGRMSLWGAVIDALKFLCLLIIVNILALIIYFTSTLLAPVIFWLVNGFLLGREYFQLVAARRVGSKAAKTLRRKHFFAIWFAGILMAIPLSIPLVNLLVPILGVATFTHQFHRLTGQRRSDEHRAN